VTVDEATVMVIVEVPTPVIVAGMNPTVTPLGCPLAESVITPLKPPVTALVIVEEPELPCRTESEEGDADRVKPGGGAVPSSALIRFAPFILPHPVARSYPVVAE